MECRALTGYVGLSATWSGGLVRSSGAWSAELRTGYVGLSAAWSGGLVRSSGAWSAEL